MAMVKTDTDTFTRYLLPPRSKECVAFDMDDTLAYYCKQRRLPLCNEFEPVTEVLAEALRHQANGTDVVIATARPRWTVYNTFQWLRSHDLHVRALYCRNPALPQGYPPHELKRGMLLDIREHWDVVGFWDDAPLNVAVARDLGIPATHVPGNESYWEAKALREGWSLCESGR